MRSAVLRVWGTTFDPSRWLTEHGLTSTSVWNVGDPRGSSPRQSSGVVFEVGEADRDALPQLVISWIEARRPALQALGALGASAELDVGVTVGTREQFTASVGWTPDHLRTLAALAIGLRTSAYPSSDAAEDNDAAAPVQSILHLALVVRDYDEAIAFYCGKLGFTLIEDTYQPAQDKRWVVVAPAGSDGTSLLLARASNPEQERFIGNQAGGRVFLFLRTDDFRREYERMQAAGIRFVREPKTEPYGTVAVFEDLYGNRWDLIEPSGPVLPK